ncbi:YadA-like family protein [Acinetobacter seifertii]|nr:ESPR-type extended signal peptide-containing protein [Acinetobacter seifertii]QPV58366.1 YadA-like family protein [Acinetobacter seifertii]
MNKIYKVIWNASLGIWVAVSEIAKGHSKTRSQRTNNALMPSTEATDFLQSSTSINFKIKPLTWGILTVLVPSITFGEVGVSGGFATGNNATAISACTGTGVGGTGDRATAGGERALAIGCGAVTDSDRDIAIGSQASTANPANATGTYNESIAIGAESRASGSQALAIGGQATATGNSSVAIGADDMDKVASTNPPAYNYTPTAGDNALYNNTATAAAYKNLTGDYLVDFEKTNGGASGVGNRYTRVQTGEAAVAVGPKATATDLGTALGPVATAGSIASVAVGVKAEARGQGSLSIGSLAYTANTGDVAVGINSAATGGDSIAIGAGSDLKGTPYVQSGASASKKGASASGVNSISIGTNTAATGTNAVVVGTQSSASNLAVAVGSVATAGDQSVSIGSNSAASSQTSVAIGARAQALQANSVALGSDSVSDRASGSFGYDPLTETSTTSTNSTWKATDAAVSVGNGTTRTRQITSVAAGTNDTDAANVAQLKKATSKVLAGTGTTVAQGTDSNGITTYTVNANTFTVRQGTTNKATIGDSTTDKVSFINGKNTVAKVADELNSNTDVTFDLADDISLNSVTTGNTTLNSSGVTVNGGANGPVKLTNTGLDNGGNKITNVAAGTVSSTSTDAVNGSQLNTTNQNVTTAQNTANTAVTNASAAQATADKGLNFSVNGGTADNVKLGETVNFANGTNTTAVYDPATNTYKYNVNDNIALTNAGSLTVGNSKVDNSGLTITGGPSVTTAGINAGNQKITNVKAGTNATDAVNFGQLNATNQNVTTAQNTANTALNNAAAAQATADKGLNFSVNGGTTDNVKLGETVNFADGTNTTAEYDPATNTYKYSVNDNIALTNAGSLTVGNTKVDDSGLTITGGPSITTAGINAANQKITNVAAGTVSSTSTDAVNGSQLNATNQNVTTAQNTANTAVTNAAAAQNTANTAVTNAAAAQATADKGLNFSVNGGTADNVKLGETVNFANGTNTTATYDPATNTYKYSVNDNIALTNAGSLTVGNTKVDNSGLSITGGPSVTTAGINAGNQKITNVKAGTNATDAVNFSQLNATNQNVTTAQNTANTALTNATAAQATADKGLNFSVNGGTTDNVKLGETVNFADGTNTTVEYDPATNTYKYNVNDNIALTNAGSLTVGNTKVDNSGLSITGGPSVTTAGINAANQKVTNVAAGTISSTSTDAVNGSQLDATNQNVTTAQNTANTAVTNAAAAQATADKGLNFSVNGGTADNVKLGETVNFADGTNTTAVYDPATNTYKYNVNDNIALTNAGSLRVGNTKVDNSGLTITGGPSVTTAGINAANQKITNVAAGTNATDAVNVSQLGAVTTAANTKTDALGISTASNLGGGAVYNPVTGAVSSPVYSVNGNNVNNVGDAIIALDKGWTLQSNGVNAGAVKAGDTVDIGTVAGESNLKVTKTGNNIQYGLNRDLNIDSVTAADSKLDTNGLTIAGGPSVTKSGIDAANQKITNVGAGSISATSTDAVNGSQLNATNQNVTTAQNTANTAVSNAAAAQATADKGLNFSVNGGTTNNVKLGETVNFADGTNTTAVYDPATNTYKYNVNDNIALTNAGSLTVGNTKVDNSGLTITGGPSVTTAGINAANQKVTNVAAGTNATDAVNVSQLGAITTAANSKTDALGTSTASNLGGGAVYNPVTGAVSSPVYSVNGNNVNNVGDAIIALDKGWTLQSNGANAGAVKAGDTVDIGTVAGESNLKVTKTGNKIQYGLNRDLNIDSVTAGDSKLDTNGLIIAGGPSVTKSGIDAANQKITNVGAGSISATSTDAVNGSQLNATNQNVTTAQNTANTAVTSAAAAQATADKGLNFSVNGGTAKNVKLGETVNFADGTNTTAVYDPATNTYKYNVNDNIALTNAGSLTVGNTKVDNSGLTITGGPSVTTAGINAGNQKITNVAAGTNATDAVNVSQLGAITTAANSKTDALGTSTASNLGGGAVYNPVTGAVSSPVYSVNGNNVNNVGDAIIALDKGWTLQSNGANAGAVKAGDTVDIGTVAGESNLKVTKTGNKIQYGLNRDLNIDSVTAGDSKLDTNGLIIAGGPSVTKSGIDAANQKITNVGAGSISATSTDAVNGSQLNATNQNVTTAQNTANTAVSNAAAAQATADKGLNFSVNGGTTNNVKLGETVNFADGTNTTAVYDPATNTYKYNVNDNIALTNAGSLTVGNTKVDNSGLTITGGPSVTTAGINAANQKVTNVAAGTNATDAVNVSQLGAITTAANSKTDALGTSTASNLGGGAVYNPVTGAVSSPVYSVNGNNVNNVGDAIIALDKGWTLQSNGANAGAVKAGDTVDIGTATGEANLKVTKTGNKIQYGLNRDLNVDSVTAGDSKLDTNGLTIAGGPSVSQSGIDAANQKITNVAAGTISATSTDAVNGSQLHTLDSRVTKNGDSTANIFGGGAKANPDGSISNPTYTVAGTSANNVGDALIALDKAVNDAGTAANAGWTVSANGDAATAKKIKPNGKVNFTGDDNLTVAQSSETDNEGNIKVALNKNLKVDSVTTGNTVIDTTGVKVGDNVQLGSTGLIIAGGPSITASGINAGNKVITNVAAGVNTTDAVNKGQLDSVITNINNNVGALANSAVQYDKNADGTVNKDSVTLAGGANGTALKNVANGTVAESSKDAVNGGQLWSVQQQVDKNTGDISNLQNNINNGKTGLVQQADKDAAITVGKDTGGTQVNVAGTAGDRTVTGVKAGAVTASSKDAVNGSQLNTTNQALVNYLGGGAGYNNITESFSNPTYNVADKSYNNVGDALGALNQADQTLNTKIDNVNNKLEQAFYATNQRIDNLEEKMSAGIAANAALENAPFIAGKVTMAVGAAYYNQQNAVGVTLRKTADNGRWSLTTGAALGSQGSPLVRVGVSTVID